MHRAFISAIQFAAVIELSRVPEPAFFHNVTGGRIIYEEVAPKALEALDIETVVRGPTSGSEAYLNRASASLSRQDLSINLSVSIASINFSFFSEDAPSDERNPPQQFVQGR